MRLSNYKSRSMPIVSSYKGKWRRVFAFYAELQRVSRATIDSVITGFSQARDEMTSSESERVSRDGL